MSQHSDVESVGRAAAPVEPALVGLSEPAKDEAKISRWSIIALIIASVALVLGIIAVIKPGEDGNGSSAQLWLFNAGKAPAIGYSRVASVYAGSGEWVSKPDMPVARSDLHAVVSNQRVILIGGLNEAGAVMDSVESFDPLFGQFNETFATLPAPLYRFAAAAIGRHIIIAGGYESTTSDPVDKTLALDTFSGQWENRSGMGLARGDVASVAYASRLYVFGGYAAGYDMRDSGTRAEVYDPVRDTWTELARMPTPRGDCGAAVVADKIVVVGGWNDATNNFVAAVEAYLPASNTWKTYEALPAPRGDKAVVAFGNRLFAIGGEIWSGREGPCEWDPTQQCNINEVPIHETLVFDPIENTWVPRAMLLTARFRFAAVQIEDAIFAFGGHREGEVASKDVVAFYDATQEDIYMYKQDF